VDEHGDLFFNGNRISKKLVGTSVPLLGEENYVRVHIEGNNEVFYTPLKNDIFYISARMKYYFVGIDAGERKNRCRMDGQALAPRKSCIF
jgi:hypothetical protein